MMNLIIYGMVFLGSALMVYNIYTYIMYLRDLLAKGYWESRPALLYFPLILLIGFLCGYLVVGLFGRPDIIMSGILFFGSVYVTLILYVLKKITGKVQEGERLKTELQTAEESSEAKTRFLSHMSHELRTPMNAIVGMNTLALKNPDLPEQTREQLEKIDTSAHHMLDLVNDILDMSRIESGSVKLKHDPFPMRGLIEQVNNIIQPQCDEKGLVYTYQKLGEMEEWYLGDVMKLRQILINILGNAVKFTPRGGTVQMQVRAMTHDTDACPLRFMIRDTGVGIDEAFLPHIFEVFSQEDMTVTKAYGGTGLGMPITKSLVELMGGEIRVASEKSKGTTFTVDITLQEVDPDERKQAEMFQAQKDAVEEITAAERALKAAQSTGAQERAAAAERQGPAGAAEPAPAAKKPEFVPVKEDAPLASEISLAGRHVLMAEDIEINAEILMDLLALEDINCDWVKNGQEALEHFEENPPGTYDAILMDLRMPVMDGLAAARAIRSLDREDAGQIPIIALTANAFEEDVRQCLEAGMDSHVAKPVDAALLCSKLRKLISGRQ